jgi:hypothetical protein
VLLIQQQQQEDNHKMPTADKGYFPIKVKYDGDLLPVVVDHPKDLRSGVGFRVLKCNVPVVDIDVQESFL